MNRIVFHLSNHFRFHIFRRCAPPGHPEPTRLVERVATSTRPSWDWRYPSKRSRTRVAAIRFTAPASSFPRPRGFPRTRQPTPERRRLPWVSCLPSGSDQISSAGTSQGSGGPHGVLCPYSELSSGGPRDPGFQPGSFRLQGFSPS
jgi:hypothetical protein